MIRRWLRLPLAALIRAVVTRPRLKRATQRALLRWPSLARMANRMLRQSSYQPPRRRGRVQGSGHLTPRALRFYSALKNELATRIG